MDTRTRDKEELNDLATRKQDWNKMCGEVCGPRDYHETTQKSTKTELKRKKEKEMEAKCQETGGKIHGTVYGGSVKDEQLMG